MLHTGIPPLAGFGLLAVSVLLLVLLIRRRGYLNDTEPSMSQYPDDFMTLFGDGAEPTEHGYTSLRMSSMFAPNSQIAVSKVPPADKRVSTTRPPKPAAPPRTQTGFAMPRIEAHLIMNSLNQVAARMAVESKREDPQLFSLSDYLRSSLASIQTNAIPMEQETTLLASYVELIASNESSPTVLKTFIRDSAFEHSIRPHLTCNIARHVLNACLPNRGVKREMSMWIDVEGDAMTIKFNVKSHGPRCIFNEDSVRLALGVLGEQMESNGEHWVISVRSVAAEADVVVKISGGLRA